LKISPRKDDIIYKVNLQVFIVKIQVKSPKPNRLNSNVTVHDTYRRILELMKLQRVLNRQHVRHC